MKITDITVNKLCEALARLGYAFFDNGNYSHSYDYSMPCSQGLVGN